MRLLYEALLELRAQRVRSILAALSLCVALLSIIAVATMGTLVREIFVAKDEQINGRMWTLTGDMDLGILTPARVGTIMSVLDDELTRTGGSYALYAEATGAAAVAAQSSHGQRDVGSAKSVRVVLIAGDLEQVRRLPVLEGSWPLSPEAIYPGGVVVNEQASADLGGVGTPIELSLNDDVLPYRQMVVGVVSDGRTEPRVYHSLQTALTFRPALASSGLETDLLVHYPGVSEIAIHKKINDVAELLHASEGVQVRSESALAEFLANLRQTQNMFAAVSIVTLLVAVIGLLNLGLATLRERVRELSLRRAVGATRMRVFGLVLTSTLLLSGFTMLFSIGIAYPVVRWWLPSFVDPTSPLQTPGFPWQAALYGMVAALAAGAIGGLVPAIAAARVDVMRVLRE